MEKIGRIVLNGRIIYSVGRSILSGNKDLVIFSDGSSVNLRTGVITNLTLEWLLALDSLPTGYKLPKEPDPVERRFKGKVLTLRDLGRRVVIVPQNGLEIVIPPTKGVESVLEGGMVTVTQKLANSPWTTISISNIKGMSIGASYMSVFGQDIVAGLLGGDSVDAGDLRILVPIGTDIVLTGSDVAVIGDTDGAVKVTGDRDVSLAVGRVREIHVDVGGDLVLETTQKTGMVKIVSQDDVTIHDQYGCASLSITAFGDVHVSGLGIIEGNVAVASEGDCDITLGNVSGLVKLKGSGEVRLRGSKISGEVTVDAEEDAVFEVGECGQVYVRTDEELELITGETKSLKLVSDDYVRVSAGRVNGDISITAEGGLELNVGGGRVGAVKLTVEDDVKVTIGAVVASIEAIVDGDGTFRLRGCTGSRRISVEGDRDVEIG